MWIQISSGKGPDECELAASLFLKEFLKEYQDKGIENKVISTETGNYQGNIKSVLVSINSKDESIISGSILWICKSPYRPNHKRKNWFIDIEIFDNPEKLTFSEKEIKFESIRSPGPGGQNVNKVETAVRATHIPTGITVVAFEERSQYSNKKLAMARIEKQIKSKNESNDENFKKTMWNQHNQLIRGNPIRVYEGKDFKLKISK